MAEPVRNGKPQGAPPTHPFTSPTPCQRAHLRLGNAVGQQHGVVLAERVVRLEGYDEVAWDEVSALVDELVESVLPVGAGLAPDNRACMEATDKRAPITISVFTCLPVSSSLSGADLWARQQWCRPGGRACRWTPYRAAGGRPGSGAGTGRTAVPLREGRNNAGGGCSASE